MTKEEKNKLATLLISLLTFKLKQFNVNEIGLIVECFNNEKYPIAFKYLELAIDNIMYRKIDYFEMVDIYEQAKVFEKKEKDEEFDKKLKLKYSAKFDKEGRLIQ